MVEVDTPREVPIVVELPEPAEASTDEEGDDPGQLVWLDLKRLRKEIEEAGGMLIEE